MCRCFTKPLDAPLPCPNPSPPHCVSPIQTNTKTSSKKVSPASIYRQAPNHHIEPRCPGSLSGLSNREILSMFHSPVSHVRDSRYSVDNLDYRSSIVLINKTIHEYQTTFAVRAH